MPTSIHGLRSDALRSLGIEGCLGMEQLWTLPAGGEAVAAATPTQRLLVIISTAQPLQLAFEATLFDLLAEERYPAPRPRPAPNGTLIAKLGNSSKPGAAAAYAWPSGEALPAEAVEIPQLLDAGRLLARLHRLGEAHPASVRPAWDGPSLVARLPQCPEADVLAPLLRVPPLGLPAGASHGKFGPQTVLFMGGRCSSILPGGSAASGPLLFDLADAVVSWALPRPDALAATRALIAGYQGLRKLDHSEREALWPALRHVAAREGARRLLFERPSPLAPLESLERVGAEDVRGSVL